MPTEIRKGSAAEYVYRLLIGKTNLDTNIVTYKPSSDKKESNKFYNGYAMLKHSNILLRVKEGTYMFNPFLVMPATNVNNLKQAWVELTNKE